MRGRPRHKSIAEMHSEALELEGEADRVTFATLPTVCEIAASKIVNAVWEPSMGSSQEFWSEAYSWCAEDCLVYHMGRNRGYVLHFAVRRYRRQMSKNPLCFTDISRHDFRLETTLRSDCEAPDYRVELADLCERIDELLYKTNSTDAKILRSYLLENKLFRQIAKEQGFATERVRQRYEELLRRLKRSIDWEGSRADIALRSALRGAA